MILAQYALIFALSAGATYIWAVKEEAIPISSAVSLAGWALLSIRGSTIEIYSDDLGTSTLVGAPSIQYFCAGMSVLAGVALLLWWFDEYPPTRQGVPTT